MLTYKDTKYYLNGVERDMENLFRLFEMFNIKHLLLLDDEVSLNSISTSIRSFSPNIIWICGHGVISESHKQSAIVLSKNLKYSSIEKNLLISEELGKAIEKSLNTNDLILIVDICHSATILNLKYYFENGDFLEKVNDLIYQPDFKNKLVIAISGATDFNTAKEDSVNGGMLTSLLISFFKYKKDISLDSLNILRQKYADDTSLIISVNSIINPYEYILRFSPSTKSSRSLMNNIFISQKDDPTYENFLRKYLKEKHIQGNIISNVLFI